MVALRDGQDTIRVVIVEVQLAPDPRKRLSWPVYVSVTRALHGCPATLLVVAPDPAVAGCRALETMMIKGYEYQSDFAKRYVAQGRAEGRAEEAAHNILTVLRARGIAVPDDVRERILAQQDPERLERWLAKAAVASSVAAVLDETN